MSRGTDRSDSMMGSFGNPLVLFLLISFMLTIFGLVMIYSASSIVCLTSSSMGNDPAYYALRQGAYAAIGLGAALVLSRIDYHFFMQDTVLDVVVVITLILLLAVAAAGEETYGASRWIRIGSFGLQPSEFAKITVILVAARLFHCYFEEQSIDSRNLCTRLLVLVAPILFFVFRQPDKGTVLIMILTMATMLFFAGFSLKATLIVVALGVGFILFYANIDPYSRARIEMMQNPWLDEFGKGYQLVQGIYAFASGGLTGVGLGMSRQKYSYLPMAHNDFIFAVIGEEFGFVGAVLVLACFLFLLYLGYCIAQRASDMAGKLIASGCVSMMVMQLLINVSGLLGIIPLSGKPIPFLSYGGSSIIATLILVGFVTSVGLHSEAARTSFEERRSAYRVYDNRSASGFRVLSGGASASPEELRDSRDFASTHLGGRVSTNANGTRRIDLGPSPSDRLRGRGTGRGGRE